MSASTVCRQDCRDRLFHLQIIVFNRFVTYNLFINIFSHVQYVDGYILYFVTLHPSLYNSCLLVPPPAQVLLLMAKGVCSCVCVYVFLCKTPSWWVCAYCIMADSSLSLSFIRPHSDTCLLSFFVSCWNLRMCVCVCVCVCVCACVRVWSPSSSVAFHAVHELYQSISWGHSHCSSTSSLLASADSCALSPFLPPTLSHLHTHQSEDGASSELVGVQERLSLAKPCAYCTTRGGIQRRCCIHWRKAWMCNSKNIILIHQCLLLLLSKLNLTKQLLHLLYYTCKMSEKKS